MLTTKVLVGVAFAVLCWHTLAHSFTTGADAAGKVYGYKEGIACVSWPLPACFAIDTSMRQEKEY